jgi:hypothetical protein
MTNVILNSHLLSELSKGVINIKKMEDFSETYPDFLNKESNITLICFSITTKKTKGLRKHFNSLTKNKANLPCILWIFYQKTLSNKLQNKLIILNYSDLKSIIIKKNKTYL